MCWNTSPLKSSARLSCVLSSCVGVTAKVKMRGCMYVLLSTTITHTNEDDGPKLNLPCKVPQRCKFTLWFLDIVHNNDKTLSLFKIPLKRFKSPTPLMPCYPHCFPSSKSTTNDVSQHFHQSLETTSADSPTATTLQLHCVQSRQNQGTSSGGDLFNPAQ